MTHYQLSVGMDEEGNLIFFDSDTAEVIIQVPEASISKFVHNILRVIGASL